MEMTRLIWFPALLNALFVGLGCIVMSALSENRTEQGIRTFHTTVVNTEIWQEDINASFENKWMRSWLFPKFIYMRNANRMDDGFNPSNLSSHWLVKTLIWDWKNKIVLNRLFCRHGNADGAETESRMHPNWKKSHLSDGFFWCSLCSLFNIEN